MKVFSLDKRARGTASTVPLVIYVAVQKSRIDVISIIPEKIHG